ncbi:hypothetical protein BKA70DRAFT_1222635 [Coprinopsis sp. MPI-PUGE-AT-0042]|nr:hypothetical protein BKA70DRAFT_1222635 [Coprinopsis sp. MPI-PUGE-AT-0042]
MYAHIFPTEVVDPVIDDLGGQLDVSDLNFHSSPPYQTLLSTSLISRAHVETSRKYLFACLQVKRLPSSRAGLEEVRRAVARVEANPSLRRYVRHLWLEAAPMNYSLELSEDEEDLEMEEYKIVAAQIDQCLAQLFQLLSASLIDLNICGDFSRYESYKSLAKSIYHAKLAQLRSMTLDCSGAMPMSMIEHLPPSLKAISLTGMMHFQPFEFNFGQLRRETPLEKTSIDLHSLTATPGFPGNMVNILHKKGFINNLVELKLQVSPNEIPTYLQVFKACQKTLQKIYLQFGMGFLDPSHSVQGLAELNNQIEGDISITLPHVKGTTVELQVHTKDDRIVDPDVHPDFLTTLLSRQPSLEQLTIIYSIHIPANQDVSARVCKSTQQWSNLDDLLSNESSIPYLRSLDVDVIFPRSTLHGGEEDEIDKPLPPSLDEEQAEMANHIKRGVHERLSKTTHRLHQA